MLIKTTKKKLYIVLGALLVSVLLGGIGFFWNSTQNTPDLSKYYLTGKFGKLPRPDGYGKTVDILNRFYLFDGLAYLRYWGERDYQKPIPDGIHRLKTKSGSEIEFQARNGVVDQLKVLSDIKQFKENESVLSDHHQIGSFYGHFYWSKSRTIKRTTFFVIKSKQYFQVNNSSWFCIVENLRGERFAIDMVHNGTIWRIKESWAFTIIPEELKRGDFADYHLLETQNMQQADIIIDGCKVIKLNLDS